MKHGLIKTGILRTVAKLQELLIKSDSDLVYKTYMFLARLHFKLHFGVSLEEEVLNQSKKSLLAARRHRRVVRKTYFPGSGKLSLSRANHTIEQTFIKNILLNTKL
jgi:hypothetical protein